MARRDASPDFIEALARGLDVIRVFQPRRPVSTRRPPQAADIRTGQYLPLASVGDPPPAALTANRAGGQTPLGRAGVRPADIRTSKRL